MGSLAQAKHTWQFCSLAANLRILWAATANTPLASAVAIFDQLLSDADDLLRAQFAWLPGDAQSATGSGPLVVPLRDRGLVVGSLSCALITSGSFAADLSKEFGAMSRFREVHCILFDESQGFGKWADAILFEKLRSDGIVKFIGDPDQPGGASYERLQKRLLKILDARHPAFRHPLMIAVTNVRVLPKILRALEGKQKGDSAAESGTDSSLRTLHKSECLRAAITVLDLLVQGAAPPAPRNNADAAGLTLPDHDGEQGWREHLLVPTSHRLHPIGTAIMTMAHYSKGLTLVEGGGIAVEELPASI